MVLYNLNGHAARSEFTTYSSLNRRNSLNAEINVVTIVINKSLRVIVQVIIEPENCSIPSTADIKLL